MGRMASAHSEEGDELRSFHALAFEAALDAFVVHENGRILDVNRSAERLFGRSADALRGAQLTSFVPEHEQEAMQQRMRERRSGPYKTTLLDDELQEVPVIINAIHHPEDGRDVRVIAIRPTSEAAGDAATLERDSEVERLEQLNNFKTQLLNTAAHELNTPLTPLRLQVHLLRSQSLGGLSERQQKAVDVLERNVERLAMLVSDILDVARLESGHLNVEKEETDLVALAQEAVQSYEETARGVGVELHLDSAGHVMVEADPRRILQVLYNLVSNGIKFTPEGGRVHVAIAVDGDDASISIQDSGLGMTRSQMDALFEPFSRVHDTETTAIPGTGLGLYISRGIIQQHDGVIEASSPGSGQGSTFRFTLPLATASTPSLETKTVAPSPLVTGPLAERLRELI